MGDCIARNWGWRSRNFSGSAFLISRLCQGNGYSPGIFRIGIGSTAVSGTQVWAFPRLSFLYPFSFVPYTRAREEKLWAVSRSSESSLSCLKLSFFVRCIHTLQFFCGSQLVQSLDFNVSKQFRVNSCWPICNHVPYFKHEKSGELVDFFFHIPHIPFLEIKSRSC